MFVRMLRARVSAKPLLRNAWDQLGDSLGKIPGWRCMVGGIDRDGGFFGTIEFTDPGAAHHAWTDGEVSRWLQEVQRSLDNVDERESADGEILLPGPRNEAGFIQFIQARTSDKPRWKAINDAMQEVMRSHRPEVLAATIAWNDDDSFLETVYFTSEQEAREGESREFPGGMAGLFGELMDLVSDLSYTDLRSPWLKVHPALGAASPTTKEEGTWI